MENMREAKHDEVTVDSDLCILLDFARRGGWWQASSANSSLVIGILAGLVELGLDYLREGDDARPKTLTEACRHALVLWADGYLPGSHAQRQGVGRVVQAIVVVGPSLHLHGQSRRTVPGGKEVELRRWN